VGGFAGGATVPPETENEAQYLAPVATGKFLWTANPLSGRVAVIDATTLRVRLTTAGDGPTEVVGLPEHDGVFGALVLNTRSDDATLLRVSDDSSEPEKSLPFRTHPDANAWVVSPSGRFAIAWTDVRKVNRPDRLQTFQDISLFVLDAGKEAVFPLSVGVRPSAFGFDTNESHVYSVSEEGISVIELDAEPHVSGLLEVTANPLDDPATRDVSFSPDGSYAVVRNDGKSTIGIVSLPAGQREEVDLGGEVTDVDLAPDGHSAFAVLGPRAEVVVVPLPASGADPAQFARLALPGEAIGSIALNADASEMIAYSTALATTRVTLLHFGAGPAFDGRRTQDLISPVKALFAAPDPRFAVTFQGPSVNSKKAGAFSLLSLKAQRVPKIVATDAVPRQIAFSPSTDAALVTVGSDNLKTFGAYLIALQNQRVDFVALESPPVAAGVVPDAARAYIAQSHPEGRITFISLDTGELQSLTGFELAARIH
jgi:DNA-binding beta-propeller fold protein YncE